VTSWPPEVEAWRRRRGLESEPALPPHAPWCRRLPEGSAPRILTPVEGAEYHLTGASAPQRLLLSAAAPQAAGRLHWFVNGGPIATAPVGESVPWPLEPGAHAIRCIDDRGRGSTVRIRVR
jgi:membrane carboxypeptidase/penicillin-binding protein PbpC